MQQIADGIFYIGVNDHELDLFEGQYIVPNGMAYNSYVVMDEKVAVMDGVDGNFVDEWMGKLETALDGRTPDYLVVQHMEPDHSGSILAFVERYPEATIVGSVGAFNMMQNYFGTKFEGHNLVVKDGATLSLGTKELTFLAAMNVHWPEVIFTYDATDKVLFTADAFGKFGALDVDEDWDCEARRYYFGIVGKFGPFVQKALAKVDQLDVQVICPLHGPILSEDLGHYLGQYRTWSAYEVETPGVVIAYSSVYGHTKEAVAWWLPTLPATTRPRPWRTRSATGIWCLLPLPTAAASSRRCTSSSATCLTTTTRSARSPSLRTARGPRRQPRA